MTWKKLFIWTKITINGIDLIFITMQTDLSVIVVKVFLAKRQPVVSRLDDDPYALLASVRRESVSNFKLLLLIIAPIAGCYHAKLK